LSIYRANCWFKSRKELYNEGKEVTYMYSFWWVLYWYGKKKKRQARTHVKSRYTYQHEQNKSTGLFINSAGWLFRNNRWFLSTGTRETFYTQVLKTKTIWYSKEWLVMDIDSWNGHSKLYEYTYKLGSVCLKNQGVNVTNTCRSCKMIFFLFISTRKHNNAVLSNKGSLNNSNSQDS